jgi:hypothetical protein
VRQQAMLCRKRANSRDEPGGAKSGFASFSLAALFLTGGSPPDFWRLREKAAQGSGELSVQH